MIIGYARVSTTGQDYAAQIDRLKAAGAEKIYEEKQSGLDRDRPKLAEMLRSIREGDTIIVTKVDRLARSAAHLHEIVDDLNKRGIGFKVLDDSGIDTTTRTGKLVFGILASIAEFETALRKERQMDGIAKAKADGRWNPGRPVTLDHDRIRAMRADGMSMNAIAKAVGCSKGAVHKVLSGSGKAVDDARAGNVQ